MKWQDLLVPLVLGSDSHRPHLLLKVAGTYDGTKSLLRATLTNDVR